jgi:hypothetical protein
MAFGSLFSNLFQKKPDPAAEPSHGSIPASQPAPAESGESRIRRRLAVDQAVNVALTAAGISASGYKHDAKRMDPNGLRFLVTIDLGKELAELSAGKLGQIGATLMQYAKAKGEAEVVSVYWRLEPDAVVAGAAGAVPPARKAEPAVAMPAAAPVPAPAAKEAAGEKIAKLRAMMKDEDSSSRSDGADPAFQRTQVMEAGDYTDPAVFDKTQVIRKSDG